jgi:polygalacturonase
MRCSACNNRSLLQLLAFVLFGFVRGGRNASCSIVDTGAVPGNLTADVPANTAAVQRALDDCTRVYVPPGVFKLGPVVLHSHTVLELASGASLTGSDRWTDYLPAMHFMPPMGNSGTQPQMLQLSPLISARFSENITITGANGTIDGNGWFAWPSANWSSPECGVQKHCAGPTFFGSPPMRPPHTLTFVHCSNVTLSNVTVTNPAYWGLQHFFSNDTSISAVTILAPRWTREIAGFMPFSVLRYAVSDSYVAVGDDAVAIMSGPDWADPAGCAAGNECPVANWSWPTRDVSFRRLFVLGRSVAVGSEDFGNVTDVLFDDCTIGDDAGSAPWAFKVKMHSNVGCYVGAITVQNTKLGRIRNNTWQDPGDSGGTAILMALSYNDPPVNRSMPQPSLGNVSFVNVTATECVSAGAMTGGLNPITGIHFENCAFRATSSTPWLLTNVSVDTCTSVNTTPPFPT